MNEVSCRFIGLKESNGQDYIEFEEISNSKAYLIPKYQIPDVELIIGNQYTFIKRYKKRLSRYDIEFKRAPQELDYIGGITKKTTKGGIIKLFELKLDEKVVTVRPHIWQDPYNWNFKTLKCRISKFDRNGQAIITNVDYRHYFYELDGIYDFEPLELIHKKIESEDIRVLIVRGQDGMRYEVKMFQGQLFEITNSNPIKCQIKDIKEIVRLTQVHDVDPYFKTIEEIISDRKLQQEYFYNLIHEGIEDSFAISKMKRQYNEKEAFWIITYVEKVLPEMLYQASINLNYLECEGILLQLIRVQNSILSNGILLALSKEKRKNAKSKARRRLERFKQELEGLKNVQRINRGEKIDYIEAFGRSIENFMFLCKYLDSNIIKTSDFNSCLEHVLEKLSSNDNDELKFYFKHTANFVNLRRKKYSNKLKLEKFNLISTDPTITEANSLQQFLNWSYFYYKIQKKAGNARVANNVLSEIIRGCTYLEDAFSNKEKLIKYAFHVLEHGLTEPLPIVFSNYVKFNMDEFPNIETSEGKYPQIWKAISDAHMSGDLIECQLIRRTNIGYEVNFKGINGFLPYTNIESPQLKKIGSNEECNFISPLVCEAFDSTFGFFIGRELPQEDPKYFLDNKDKNMLQVGQIVLVTISSFANFGVFVNYKNEIGLLHNSKVFHFWWDYSTIKQYFKLGQKLKVQVEKIDNDQVEFSFQGIREIDPEYYYKVADGLVDDLDNSDDLKLSNPEEENEEKILYQKALTIERWALYQFDIEKKINTLYIARQFYAQINQSRSYLINIFIEYFKVLLKLKTCIELRQIEDIIKVQVEAKRIQKSLSSLTIEIYPDSQKLVFFLRIIELFNDKSEDALHSLFNYMVEFSNSDNSQRLKTLSKITLSNNLLASEVSDNDDVIFKNLDLIYVYLSSGILTLVETEDDKYSREMKEKAKYYLEMISRNESERLELKSSLLIPYPSKKELEVLDTLKKKEQSKAVTQRIDEINGETARKKILHSAFKNLCAFANTEGGVLIIGVNDDLTIRGISNEYSVLRRMDRDGYGITLDNLINKYFEESFSSLLRFEFIEISDNKEILVIQVKPSKTEVFIRINEHGKSEEELYIRRMASAQLLKGTELAKFIKNRVTQ